MSLPTSVPASSPAALGTKVFVAGVMTELPTTVGMLLPQFSSVKTTLRLEVWIWPVRSVIWPVITVALKLAIARIPRIRNRFMLARCSICSGSVDYSVLPRILDARGFRTLTRASDAKFI